MSLSFLGYLNGSATESGNVFITDVPNTYMSYGNLNISGVDAMRIDSRELNSDLYIGVSAITSGNENPALSTNWEFAFKISPDGEHFTISDHVNTTIENPTKTYPLNNSVIKIRYRNTTRIEIQVDGETVGNSLDTYVAGVSIQYAAENQGSNIPEVSSAVEKIESNLDPVNPPTVTVSPLDTFIFTLGSNTTKVDSMAKIRLEIVN